MFSIYIICSKLFLFLPIMTLFYKEEFLLTYSQILFIQIIFSIITILNEIPSGVFADKVGYKKSLITASLLSIISIIIYITAKTYLGLILASILGGLANSTSSGTDTAFLYELLKEYSIENKFRIIMSKLGFWFFLILAISGLPAGFVAKIDYRILYYISLIPQIVALLLLLFMTDIEKNIDKNKIKIKFILIDSINQLKGSSKLLNIIIISSLTMALFETINQLYQPYLIENQINLEYIGIVFFVTSLTASIGSRFSNIIVTRLGQKKSMYAYSILMSVFLFFLYALKGPIVIIFYTLFRFLKGFSGPLLGQSLNDAISSNRATVLSTASFVNRALFSLIALVVGYFTDIYELRSSFIIIGFFSISLIFLVSRLYKK